MDPRWPSSGPSSRSGIEQRDDLGVLWEAALLVLRKDEPAVDEHVELALPARLDLGIVLGLGVQPGRETRGPLVVAVSDWAVEDPHLRHAENLPTLRKPLRRAPFCSDYRCRWRQP
jgi:hypothetical protein